MEKGVPRFFAYIFNLYRPSVCPYLDDDPMNMSKRINAI